MLPAWLGLTTHLLSYPVATVLCTQSQRAIGRVGPEEVGDMKVKTLQDVGGLHLWRDGGGLE